MDSKVKKVLIAFVLINIVLLIGALIYFLTKGKRETVKEVEKHNTIVEKNEVNACFSTKLKYNKNQFITGKFAKAIKEDEDSKPTRRQTYSYIDNKSFNLADLKNYSYGFQIKDSPTGYYVDYEICDLSNNKTLTYPKLFKGIFYERDKQYAGTTWQDGEQANFGWEAIDGSMNYPMDKAGNYSLNVYISGKTGEWEWADKLEFEVK